MRWIFFTVSLLVSNLGQAQQTDSLAAGIDTVAVDTGKVGFFNFKADYPNPRKALFLSLMLPGAGQAYNKRWWKLPIVYGAFAGVIYAIDYNQDLFNRLQTALELEIAGEEHEFTGTGIDSEAALRSNRDQFDRNTQLSYVGLGVLYAVVAIEAFVDAHLKDFNIDDNLSARVKPDLQPTVPGMAPAPGIGVTFTFGRSQQPIP